MTFLPILSHFWLWSNYQNFPIFVFLTFEPIVHGSPHNHTWLPPTDFPEVAWTPWQPPVRSFLWFDLFIYFVFLFRLLQQFWYCFKFTFICAVSLLLPVHLHFLRPSQTMLLVCTLSSNNTDLISCLRHRFCGHILFLLFIYLYVCAACPWVCERPHLQGQRRILGTFPHCSLPCSLQTVSHYLEIFSYPILLPFLILAIFLISYFIYIFYAQFLKILFSIYPW